MKNAKEKPKTIFTCISPLFYISKVFGVIPYSLSDYYGNKIFVSSIIGSIWCICSLIHYCLQYHFAIIANSMSDEKKIGALTTAIGIFLIYVEPFMMCVDMVASIINQKSIKHCFERLEKIDEKLSNENIAINYSKNTKTIYLLGFIALFFEFGLASLNILIFNEEFTIGSLGFFFTGIPLFINAIAKIWFVLMVTIVRDHFRAINNYFVETKNLFHSNKTKYKMSMTKNYSSDDVPGFLSKEIIPDFQKRGNWIVGGGGMGGNGNYSSRSNKRKIRDSNFSISSKVSNDVINVMPYQENFKDVSTKNSKMNFINNNDGSSMLFNEKEFLIGDKMDKKLILLCRLHDEICEIGKSINAMFSFQMLLTMAYGFMSTTAQFYFLYCGLMGQQVPVLFRSAESVVISIFYILYTASKCVLVIYVSWKTKQDAQKTGVHLHKVANVVDENHFYHIINHLSLKLLNHQLNFTACGFFDLDMTTVYAITGAITSYLIILIQFNLAANRVKKPDATNSTAMTLFENITTGVTAQQ